MSAAKSATGHRRVSFRCVVCDRRRMSDVEAEVLAAVRSSVGRPPTAAEVSAFVAAGRRAGPEDDDRHVPTAVGASLTLGRLRRRCLVNPVRVAVDPPVGLVGRTRPPARWVMTMSGGDRLAEFESGKCGKCGTAWRAAQEVDADA